MQSFRIRIGIALCLLLTLASCRSTFLQEMPEPSASELSATKDQFYHFLLAPTKHDPNRYTFYTCHAWSEFRVNNPVDSCVIAYRDKDSKPFSIPKSLVEESTAATIYADKQLQGLKRAGTFQSVLNVGALTGMSLVTAVFAAKAASIAIGVAVVGGIGGGVLIFMSKEQAEKYGIDKEAIAKQIQEKLSQGGKLAASAVSSTTKTLEKVRNPEDNTKLQIEVWGNTRTTVATYFQDIIDDDPERIREVRSRIPYMLPVFARVMRNIKWADRNTLAYHCLPKSALTRSEEPRSMCIPIKKNWPAGSSFHYSKPADDAMAKVQKNPEVEYEAHPLKAFVEDNKSSDPDYEAVKGQKKRFCLFNLFNCKNR